MSVGTGKRSLLSGKALAKCSRESLRRQGGKVESASPSGLMNKGENGQRFVLFCFFAQANLEFRGS